MTAGQTLCAYVVGSILLIIVCTLLARALDGIDED